MLNGMGYFLLFWGFLHPTREFFTQIETSTLPAKASNFDLYSAPMIMVIDKWGFFSVPNLLWNGAYVYNGHLRGPVTPIPVVTTCFYDLGDSNTQPSECEANALTDCTTALYSGVNRQKQTYSITIMWFDKSRMHHLKRNVIYYM